MKKYLFILSAVLVIGLTSCDNTPAKVENPAQATTVELQQKAMADTTCYKIVVEDNKLYALNEDNVVVASAKNEDGGVAGLILLIIVGLVLLTIGTFVFSND